MRFGAVVPVCLAMLALAAPFAAAADVDMALAAIPEPTGGMALLCGLLAVAFIARRKTSWPEG